MNAVPELIEEFQRHSVAALARIISIVESGHTDSERLLTELRTPASTGSVRRLGITGAPGVGKSTLVKGLIRYYRQREMTVAVVAIDPTSAVTGGALLGDRIRMSEIAAEAGVYVRSMATRGAWGGMASTTRSVCDVLDAFGFDRIIIETVGVGQSEMAVTEVADVTALVLVPESGDGVQVLKAGIVEVVDLFVINKADRTGAEQLAAELSGLAGILAGNQDPATDPAQTLHHRPVLQTVAIDGKGVAELAEALEESLGF